MCNKRKALSAYLGLMFISVSLLAQSPVSLKHQTQAPWAKPDQIIDIGTQPGLRYDVEEVIVPAGAKIQINFNNSDAMVHNLVLVQPGSAVKVGEMALTMGIAGEEQDYVPDSDLVLFHTLLLQPGTNETIFLVAPATPGDYTIVCTVPGHYFNMQATLKVI